MKPHDTKISDIIDDFTIIERLEGKFNKVEDDNNGSLWEERGYDRMWLYPQYLIFGAGSSRTSRFIKARHQNELHASLPSIWFCYGLIPLIILCRYLYEKFKKAGAGKIVYLALILESFTLINYRQVLFWAIFVLGEFIVIKNNNKKLEIRNA